MATNISIPTYGFVNHILALNEGNWRTFFKPFITDSVQSGLATIAGANMTVYVSAGECRCGAVMGILDEMIALDIANGDSTYDRIDSVIVQYTYGEPSTLAVAIVQGTPSANPVPPTLTKVYDTLWQMEIAQILVPSGATSSSEFTITDKRVIYESIESIIDDNTESEERVWSSQKTREEIVSLSTEIYDSLNTKADVITRTVSGNIVTITDGGNNLPVKELVVDIEPVQAGTGDPSPENVRPISGWDEVVVTRTGKNLLIKSSLTEPWDGVAGNNFTRTAINNYIQISLYGTDGLHFKTGTAGNAGGNGVGFKINLEQFGIKIGDVVTFSASIKGTVTGSTSTGWKYYHSVPSSNTYYAASVNFYNIQNFSSTSWQRVSGSFTVADTGQGSNKGYAYIIPSIGFNAELYVKDIQLEFGSVANPYEDNNKVVLAIDLGDTRYGGVLDVMTGEMTVTDGYIASYNGETLPSTWISDRDVYAEGTIPTIGAQVVYKLASPQTIQLSSSKIQTLLGTNHVFADTGDILNLTYRADMKIYVDEHVAEANLKTRQMMTTVTTKMVAPDNLVIGDIVIVNDDLYKVINSNIASGASMVVGTNVEQITLTEYIQSLI